MVKLVPAALRNSYDWIEYFYQNAREPELPWNEPRALSGAEKMAVTRSIQQFQLGEDATGKRLIDKAQRFARQTGDLGFVFALRLFIREEQRHSRILAQFLRKEGAPCLRRHWVHGVFRTLRGLAGLELCMRVLATAEVIAISYYKALREATASTLLRKICELILEEECAHLRFQSFAMRLFRRGRKLIFDRLADTIQRVFLLFTAGVVWIEHRSVFRAAGWSLRRFWSESLRELESLCERQQFTAESAIPRPAKFRIRAPGSCARAGATTGNGPDIDRSQE